MTAAHIVDGLTGSECRQALLAFLQSIERHDWHRDTRRLLADIAAAVELAERLAVELRAHGLLKHPVDGLFLLAIRHVRELPPNTRRLRSDFNGRHHGPQRQIPEVV